MILDTSFVLDLIAGDAGARARAVELEEQNLPQRLPAHVIYELYTGVGYTDTSADEEAELAAVLSGRSIVETTPSIAKRAGRLEGELRREGVRVPSSVLLIGATALEFEESVVTGDVEQFERLPGVSVIGY